MAINSKLSMMSNELTDEVEFEFIKWTELQNKQLIEAIATRLRRIRDEQATDVG